MNDITMLVLADLHSGLYGKDLGLLDQYRDKCDIIITLGDIPIEGLIEINMDFGVLGNHDSFGGLGDKDIHSKRVDVQGVSIVGMQGSHRYKEGRFVMCSHEESKYISTVIPKADILVSHDSRYNEKADKAHCGLLGVTKYLDEKKPFLHIHGHHHVQDCYKYNETTVVSVYKCALIEVKSEIVTVTNIF